MNDLLKYTTFHIKLSSEMQHPQNAGVAFRQVENY